jgi:hypothetical protein
MARQVGAADGGLEALTRYLKSAVRSPESTVQSLKSKVQSPESTVFKAGGSAQIIMVVCVIIASSLSDLAG